jgi:UDP-N-acetylmuramate-alanine ligase
MISATYRGGASAACEGELNDDRAERKSGSRRESDEAIILGRFREDHEFGPRRRHFAVSSATGSAGVCIPACDAVAIDVPIHGFHNTQKNVSAAVVQNALEVVQQHLHQFLEGFQTLLRAPRK